MGIKVAKIEIFPSYIDWYWYVLVKISLKITLSLAVSEIFTIFYFPLKSKMAEVSCENWYFSLFNWGTLVLPCGSKMQSKSLYLLWFLRYFHFFIFHWNLRWPSYVVKIESFPFSIRHLCTTLWIKKSLEIALSLKVSEIFTFFIFR